MKPRTVVLTITLEDCDTPLRVLRKMDGVRIYTDEKLEGNDYFALAERPRVDVIQPPKGKR